MTAPGIAARGVRRSFGDVHAVRDVGFEAQAGRITGLVGPNGAGKTTLLLMLASLLAPDDGELRVGGVDPVTHPQDARRLVGWMPDALGAWPSLTARESLVVTGRLYGMPRAAAEQRANELLHRLTFADLADVPARVLSRGQKQKLGLARALVHDPQVLLLDEPASGLDPQARVQLRELLRQLAGEGRTILISSHILIELEEIVDDAVFIVAGRTVDPVQAAAGTQRAWRIRVAGELDLDAVARALEISTADVRADRGAALVAFGSDDAAAAGLRALVTGGVAVIEYAPVLGSLETAYLDLDAPAVSAEAQAAPPPPPPAHEAPADGSQGESS